VAALATGAQFGHRGLVCPAGVLGGDEALEVVRYGLSVAAAVITGGLVIDLE
jgi:hypothetical protein